MERLDPTALTEIGHGGAPEAATARLPLGPREQFLLYDPALIRSPGTGLFEPGEEHVFASTGVTRAGRQAIRFLRLGSREFVLRHYWRGGRAAKLSKDGYLWLGADRSRPFREWRLLSLLWQLGLPVPRPAAARIVRQGILGRGDILIERIPDTETLAERAARQPLPAVLWQRVGNTIRRFHEIGAYHADLNASNVLVDGQDNVFLIDWDRGRLRRPSAGWQQANLARLARSLAKFRRRHPGFHYGDDDWQVLISGYRQD